MIEELAKALHADLGYNPDNWAKDRGLFISAMYTILTRLREPSREMIEAGISKAEDCIDSDWDSGPDGESYNSYQTLGSDTPQQIYQAMIDAISPPSLDRWRG